MVSSSDNPIGRRLLAFVAKATLSLAFLSIVTSIPSMGQSDDLAKELPRIPPVEPDKVQETFAIQQGFRLVPSATEPLVEDPVSMIYDSRGRAYVVEMRGYPFPEERPTGKVRRLIDRDGDGVFDEMTDFLSDLDWPTAVVPYKDGVFVAAPPEIIYARDDNGDGIADTKKVMFSGFGTQNVQALLNGLIWGTDGWIYGSAGGNGGEIKNHTNPNAKPVSVRGRDFRFKPDGSAFEAISGGGQFGHCLDDWGHRFVSNNSNHIRQILVPSYYLERNPNVFQSAVLLDIPAEGAAAPVYRTSQTEPWRIVRTRQRASDPEYRKRLPATELVASGFFTSATGVTIYRGTSYPEQFRNNAFIGDVGGNLVHRKILTKDGSHYVATRADKGVEFITSTDNWFRPVNFANTPHGTLMVLDMYRETIEHPYSIPEEIKKHLDLTSGKNRGRLYHLLHGDFRPRPIKDLESTASAELVPLLADSDSWWRETAQRLILERGDKSVVPQLKALATTSKSDLGQTHALWTLAALGSLDGAILAPAFEHKNPFVREQAAKLSEPFLKSDAKIASALMKLADDPDGFVQLQVAFSLGELQGSASTSALARLAGKSSNDTWIRTAILTSLKDREIEFLKELAASNTDSENVADWAEQVAILVAAKGKAEELTAILDLAFAPEKASTLADPVLNGLSTGAERTGKNLSAIIPADRKPLFQTRIETALKTIRDTKAPESNRLAAFRLARLGAADAYVDACTTMLSRENSPAVQMAAVRALSASSSPEAGKRLIEKWSDLGPAQRREVIEALLARADRLPVLLDAIEGGTIAPTELDLSRRQQLTTSKTSAIAKRALAIFGDLSKNTRSEVLAKFADAAKIEGNPKTGETVFRKVCATCHKAGTWDGGSDVGPNLLTVVARSPEDLLGHIIDPNKEIAPQYMNYTVALNDGRILSGLIASETTNNLVLKRAEGVTETIARSQIEEVRSTGQSLMPEGLEQGLQSKDFADLISFIKSLGGK
jgi:putative membrane-bound dehydrogenase-like protein